MVFARATAAGLQLFAALAGWIRSAQEGAMPASSIDRIRDPLIDRFEIDELTKMAPWVYEEIQAIGADRIRSAIADQGFDAKEPQSMQTWVSAIRACHSDLWSALAQG